MGMLLCSHYLLYKYLKGFYSYVKKKMKGENYVKPEFKTYALKSILIMEDKSMIKGTNPTHGDSTQWTCGITSVFVGY